MQVCTVLTLVLCWFSTIGFAQGAKYDDVSLPKATITPIIYIGEFGDTVAFPQITLPNKQAQDRINRYLEYGDLGLVPPGQLKRRIKSSLHPKGPMMSLNYVVRRNDGRLLSLEFSEEGVGAYLYFSDRYVTFDLINGNPVIAEDLFSATGYPVVMQMIRDGRTRAIKVGVEKDIRYMTDSTIWGPVSAEDMAQIIKDFQDLQDEFAECAKDTLATEILITDSIFEPNSLTCLPHVDAGYDFEWNVNIPLTSIQPYLSEYGKGLLGLAAPLRNPQLRQQFKYLTGTIGSYPVTMVISSDRLDGNLRSSYYYNSKGKPIDLHGTIDQGVVTLTEFSETSKAERFIGSFKDNTFTGTWYDASGKRSLPFVLTY